MRHYTDISSLHIIGSKGPGGAENFYSRLVMALHQAGSRVHAINPPNSHVTHALDSSVNQTHPGMRSIYDPLSRWQIKQCIRREQPDIVQTYMGRATRLTHLRQGDGPVHVARLGGYYNLKGYRHAHAWIGNTLGIVDYLVSNGLPHERVFHVNNFVDPVIEHDEDRIASIKNEQGIPADALLVCSIGRLHTNKAFDTLLKAFSGLPAEISGRPVHLLIAGDGDLKPVLQSQARALSIDSRVHWAGWQNDTSPCYHMADVFICPSRHETLGNVILEAWAHHCPVISTNTKGGMELIEHGHNGLLTPVDEAQAMTDIMLELLRANPQQNLALADRGLQTVRDKFSKKIIVENYLSVYQHLIQNKS